MLEHAVKIGRVTAVDGASVKGLLIEAEGVESENGSGAASGYDWAQIGSMVKVRTRKSSVFGVIGNIATTDISLEGGGKEKHLITIDLVGESFDEGEGEQALSFQRGVSCYPVIGEEIFTTTKAELQSVYAEPNQSNVRIGTIYPDYELPAYLMTDNVLGKHFAILGSTGSGKSCSTTLILRSILSHHPNGHIVMLDPHDEYATAFGDLAYVLHPDRFQLPYWLLNFEEITEVLIDSQAPDSRTQVEILKTAILNAKIKHAENSDYGKNVTVDTPVPYSLNELIQHINTLQGRLEKPEGAAPYMRLKSRLDNLRGDKRFDFMFSGLFVRDNLVDIISNLLRIPVDGKPISIVDLSGIPSEITDVVVSVMCRIIFDFALWSVPAQALPVLVVCEEAHRYIPVDDSLGFGPTKRAITRIAMEGRKYGVSLCLVSQRPSQLSPNILSQCNTLFSLRLTNEADQDVVQRALPEHALGLLNALPALRTQEAVAVGEGMSLPTRLRFDDLPENRRPKSGSAPFSKAWERSDENRAFVEMNVGRWRDQVRFEREEDEDLEGLLGKGAEVPEETGPAPEEPRSSILRKEEPKQSIFRDKDAPAAPGKSGILKADS